MENKMWEIIRRTGISMSKLERLSGVSDSQLNRIADGESDPTVPTAYKIVYALGYKWNKEDWNALFSTMKWSLRVAERRKSFFQQVLRFNKLPVEACTFEKGINGYYKSFSQVHSIVVNCLEEMYPKVVDYDKFIGAESTMVAMIYFTWLGIKLPQLSNATITDCYDEKNQCFYIDDERYNFGEYPSMVTFFKVYYNSEGYTACLSDGRSRKMFYRDDCLLRALDVGIKTGAADYKTYNISHKARKIFNIDFTILYKSGRLFALYEFELKNGSVFNLKRSRKDIERVAHISSEASCFAFLREYKEYKTMFEN